MDSSSDKTYTQEEVDLIIRKILVMRQEAYTEGYNDGFNDGYQQALWERT